jgi:hypothetical protein
MRPVGNWKGHLGGSGVVSVVVGGRVRRVGRIFADVEVVTRVVRHGEGKSWRDEMIG